MAFSTFIHSVCSHHHLIPRYFHHLKRKTQIHEAVTPFYPSAHSLVNANLGFVSMDLCILDISYKWNNPICGLLCLLFKVSTLFSRDIHVVAYISTSFLFMTNSPLCGYTTFCFSIHQLVEIWAVSTFLAIGNNAVMKFTYKILFECLFPIGKLYS